MPIATGARAPDFTLPRRDRGTFRLAEAKGAVLLAFCKTGCPTCRLAFPFVEKLHRAYDAFPVLGVSQDEAAPTDEFCGAFGITFPMLLEAAPWPVSSSYDLIAVPTLVLVGKDGVVVDVMEGWQRPAMNRLAAKVAEWIGAKPAEVSTPADGAPELKPG